MAKKKKEPQEPPETLGQRIKRLREAKGSQRDFARSCGLPVGVVRNIEQGISMPTLQNAQIISMSLGISLDALLDGVELKKPRRRGRPTTPSP